MVSVVSVVCQSLSVESCSACGRVAWQHIVQNVCFAVESRQAIVEETIAIDFVANKNRSIRRQVA